MVGRAQLDHPFGLLRPKADLEHRSFRFNAVSSTRSFLTHTTTVSQRVCVRKVRVAATDRSRTSLQFRLVLRMTFTARASGPCLPFPKWNLRHGRRFENPCSCSLRSPPPLATTSAQPTRKCSGCVPLRKGMPTLKCVRKRHKELHVGNFHSTPTGDMKPSMGPAACPSRRPYHTLSVRCVRATILGVGLRCARACLERRLSSRLRRKTD